VRHALGENHRLGAVRQIFAPELLIALECAGRAIGVIVIDQFGEAPPRASRGLASFDQRRIDRREALREKEERIAVERDVMHPLVLPNLHAALAYGALAPESFNCERVP
jgi:hypothetical protein